MDEETLSALESLKPSKKIPTNQPTANQQKHMMTSAFTEEIELLARDFEHEQDCIVPLNNLPPVQAALSIEKIRNLIFSYSAPQDLLQFRLVSQAWCEGATNEKLLNWKENEIHVRFYECKEADFRVSARSCRWNKKIVRPLRELIELIDETTGFGSFPCTQFKLEYEYNQQRTGNPEVANRLLIHFAFFICVSFLVVFWIMHDLLFGASHSTADHKEEGRDELEAFLTKHGNRIKKLKLHTHYLPTCNSNRELQWGHCPHSIQWLMEFVTKLTLEQTPNLVKLKINHNHGIHWNRNNNAHFGITCQPIETTMKDENSPALTFHKKLQSVTVENCTAQSLFEFFCRLAPNLKELVGECELQSFLEAKNRVDLLGELFYRPGLHHEEDKCLQRIANSKDKLSLKTLALPEVYKGRNNEKMSRITDTVNKLLEKSCHSVEELILVPLGFMPGLKIPISPHVKSIHFGLSFRAYKGTRVFPQGIYLSETFPNLQTIVINNCVEKAISRNSNFLVGSDEDIVLSVKTIFTPNAPNPLHLEKYQKWFPQAVIKNIEQLPPLALDMKIRLYDIKNHFRNRQ